MELTESLKTTLIETAKSLRGSDRRLFMARSTQALGPDRQRQAARALGWNRATIRKGRHELVSGIRCCDAFAQRGRHPAEEQLPNLLVDIRALVNGQSQTDPRFRTQRLYTRLSAAEVRQQLIVQKGYSDEELPTVRTSDRKLNHLGYCLTKVAKCKPKKRFRKPMRSSRG